MGDETTYKMLLEDNRIIFPRGGDGMPRKKYFRYELEQEGQCATNWWEHTLFGYNQVANDLLTSLFGLKNVFSNPKPIELLRGLIQIANVKNDDIVLDFFSGSATTAHAVIQFNAENKQQCRFISVQFPENINPKKGEATIEFSKSIDKHVNISEVGKERLRRAGKEIAKIHSNVDVGFRVFKLDKSNFKVWDDSPIERTEIEKLHQQMDLFADSPFIYGRSHEDIIYEIMRINNYPLTTPIVPIEINDQTVYGVGKDCDFTICLNVLIDETAAEELCKYRPGRILFTDSCFENTEIRVNVEHAIRNINAKIKLKVV